MWWHYTLGALVGALIGWVVGLPYKKEDANKTSKLTINLVLGAAGGAAGSLAFWLMTKLAVAQVLGIIIMSSGGAILLLWLMSRAKKAS